MVEEPLNDVSKTVLKWHAPLQRTFATLQPQMHDSLVAPHR
jgi:hypothetical protein